MEMKLDVQVGDFLETAARSCSRGMTEFSLMACLYRPNLDCQWEHLEGFERWET